MVSVSVESIDARWLESWRISLINLQSEVLV